MSKLRIRGPADAFTRAETAKHERSGRGHVVEVVDATCYLCDVEHVVAATAPVRRYLEVCHRCGRMMCGVHERTLPAPGSIGRCCTACDWSPVTMDRIRDLEGL